MYKTRVGLGASLLSTSTLASGAAFRPSLRVDFLIGALDPRITFTRSTTATFTGSNGFIQSAAIDAPRFDYDPVTLAPKGLLIEGARTNLLTFSSGFTNAIWTKSQGGAGVAPVVTANAGTAPDGTSTATRLQLNAGGSASTDFSFIQQAVTGLANPHASSRTIWMKSNTGGSFIVALRETATLTYTLVTVTSTWTRFEHNVASIAAVGDGLQVIVRGTYGTTQAVDILIWGGQLELGAFPTSYIPTVASTVARGADVASMTGTNFSSWYSAVEGTFAVQADTAQLSASVNSFTLAAGDGTTNNRIALSTLNTAGAYAVVTGGASQAAITPTGTVAANTAYKIAGAYAANNFASSLNGGAVGTDTSGTVPTVDRLLLGANSGGTSTLNGHLRSLIYYRKRLPNAQLQVLTT